MLLTFFIGIVIGAVFHGFWRDLYFKALLQLRRLLNSR